nr:pentapeptide repeat-containing protein [Natronolimnobius sp. AArcel1]
MESTFALTADDWTRGRFDFSGATFRHEPTFLETPADGQSTETTGRTRDRTPVFGDRLDCRDVTFLAGVDFSDARFPANATFDRADLSNVNFAGADFTGDGDVSRATFNRADLSGANLSGAILTGASFEGARLSRAYLLDADLVGAALYGALLGDARINRKTRFWPETTTDGRLQHLYSPAESALQGSFLQRIKTVARGGMLPYCVYDPRYPQMGETVTADGGAPNEGDAVEKAAETYGTLESLARENSLSRLASQCFLGRKDIQLRQYRREADWQMVCRSIVPSVVARYGESPWRVLGTGTLTVVLCGLAYWVFDLIERVGDSGDPISLFDGLYFSALTFTTLGYGDFRPTTRGGQVLAVAETASGVILLAILVFVFGRRATR